ncbi:Na+/H+ antiporter NhaC family protein [Pseudalkalibacillus caeni]|uniref:Sodium:proton antiporter n=1 Tax=Exobacillus caeni TaxID=2574798 RepID=A0A5R9FAJ7_9BACL|nr:Na+/H+ antiporter NhaC family protein [Pseudalkalibacillus caeni]TLS37574.1 sodium:proton antiporter [Pseudalkalibacillus caeni]
MESGWVSLLPFVSVIIIAVFTKQVLPGLTAGLIVASYLASPGILSGIEQLLSYLIEGLTDKNNIKIILFLYVFAGLIGMIKFSGGIKGFVEEASNRIKSKKGALLLTWISTIGTFAAPSFRIVTIAPIMRALLKKVKMTPQELGFVIETTASPIIVLIPVATAFVGYMASVIEISLESQKIMGDGYSLFIQSIPYNFFSIAIILLGFYLSFFHHSKKPATDAGNKEMEVKGEEDWVDCHPAVSKDLPSKPLNLVIPLVLIILLTLFLTFWSGYQKGEKGILSSFIEADVLDAMVIALLITLFISITLFLSQRYSLRKAIEFFVDGGNDMMPVILLLAVVWALASATEDLGFSEFVTNNVNWIPKMFIPPVLFLLGAAISYFIGSSWGTWGILMPLGVSLAQVSDTSLPIVIGAVFASGTFGAFASPLSDNTNTIANILNLKVLPYARFKLIPALIAASIAAVFYAIVPFIK